MTTQTTSNWDDPLGFPPPAATANRWIRCPRICAR